jgi:hypothetical protein
VNEQRQRWILAIGLALVGTAIGIAARGAGPLPGDLPVARAIQGIGAFDSPLGGLLALLGKAIWLLAALALIAAVVLRRWSTALLLMAGGVAGLAIGEYVLKPLVARPRPSPDLLRVLEPSTSYSFPSST